MQTEVRDIKETAQDMRMASFELSHILELLHMGMASECIIACSENADRLSPFTLRVVGRVYEMLATELCNVTIHSNTLDEQARTRVTELAAHCWNLCRQPIRG